MRNLEDIAIGHFAAGNRSNRRPRARKQSSKAWQRDMILNFMSELPHDKRTRAVCQRMLADLDGPQKRFERWPSRSRWRSNTLHHEAGLRPFSTGIVSRLK